MSVPDVQLPPVASKRLANGLQVLVVERRSLPLVTFRLTMRAGGAQEPPSRPGIAGLTARLLRRGAGARDAVSFAEELDFLGGLLGAGAGLDHFALDAEFTSDTIEAGLGLLLDVLREPRFEEAEVERERRLLMDEVRSSRDDPDEMADEAFLHFLHEGHPYSRCTVGSTRALELLGRGDLLAFHGERFAAQGSVLVVVGDVSGPELLARLDAELSGWALGRPEPAAPPAPVPIRGRPVVLVDAPGSRQVQYRLCNVGVARSIPDWHALLLANTIFGGGFTSRLVDRVRVDAGLTYGISSRFLAGRVPGPFVISSFTDGEQLGTLHELVTSLLRDFREQGPTAKELEAAKAYQVGLQPRRIETNGGLATAIADAELHGLGMKAITGFRRDLEAVTLEQARSAAARYFPSEDVLTVLVGDAERLREAAGDLGELQVVPLDFGERVAEGLEEQEGGGKRE